MSIYVVEEDVVDAIAQNSQNLIISKPPRSHDRGGFCLWEKTMMK